MVAVSGHAQSSATIDSLLPQQAWQNFDQPINPETYLIRPGEKFTVSFIGTTLKPLELVVDAEGAVTDPGLGRFDLAHKTLAQTRQLLSAPLLQYFRAREIVISVAEARPISIAVTGAVRSAGTYRVYSSQTVSDVIALAGGILPGGSRRGIVFSGGADTVRVDLERALALGDPTGNPPLYSGRSVFVPTLSGQSVVIRGEVNRPGTVELAAGDDLRTVLLLAGGLRSSADTSFIHYANTTEHLRLSDSVKPGQHIVVPPSVQALQQRGIVVSGAVAQPGSLAYRADMTVDGAIAAVGGMTGVANKDRITVFRRAEDGKTLPEGTERYPMFNTPTMTLQPFDSVVVPARVGYVTVTGATSGSRFLPFAAGQTAGAYIDAAGGVPKTALRVSIKRLNRVTGMRLDIRAGDMVADGDELVVSWEGGDQ